MPSLKKVETTRLYIPSTKDAPNEADRIWVDVKSSLLLSDFGSLGDGNQIDQTLDLLSKVIVDWNLTVDGSEEKLPVTKENVDAFGGQYISDFSFLGEWISEHVAKNMTGLEDNEKKTSLSISVATEPTETPPPII